MRAVFLNQNAATESLITGELPPPKPGRGEVLVKIYATAVTPTEIQWFPTFKKADGTARPFPIVLSHEFSGVIAALGEGVEGFLVGDSVYGLNDWFTNGALAEYCVAPATAIALKPETLDHTQAAAVPISALTAGQGLFDHGQLKPGQNVLVHGGAGGVGLFAVQLARWHGAHVTATASARNLDFVRELGAEHVIDYKTTPFEEVAKDIDVVFDTVGGETLKRSLAVLKPGGKMISVAAEEDAKRDARSRAAFFIVEPNHDQLTEIAGLLDSGAIKSFVEAIYPLAQTREAFARAARGGMRGKVVVQVAT